MPPAVLDRTLEKYNYIGDDTSVEEIRMNKVIGDAVGNPITTNRIEYSIRHKKLRMLNLKFEDGGPGGKIYRKRVVCCDVANPLWTGAVGTVTIGPDTWTVSSRTQQRLG